MRIGNKTFKRLFREQLTNDRNLCCAKIETKEIEEQKMNFEKQSEGVRNRVRLEMNFKRQE